MSDKIIIKTVDFATAVEAVRKSIPKTTPIPSLYYIHFQLKRGELVLTSSDTITMTMVTILLPDMPFEFEPFTVLVDSDRLIKFVLSLDTEDISINPDLENDKIVLRSKGRRTTLNTIDAREYIKVDFEEPDRKLGMNVEQFGLAVKRVAGYHLKHDDPSLSMMRGIELIIGDNGFRVTGATNYMGATYIFDEINDDAVRTVVIGDQLLDVSKSLSGCDELYIGIPDDQHTKIFFYGFVSGNIQMKIVIQVLARLNEYPDIRTMFINTLGSNKADLLSFYITKPELLNSLKPTEAYDDDYVTVFFDSAGSLLHVLAEDDHIGEYNADVECEVSGDKVVDTAFRINKKYLKKAFDNLDQETAELMTCNELPIVVIRNLDDNENQYLQGIAKIAM